MAIQTSARRASPEFFGWRVVGAAFTVLFAVYAIQFSFGTFVDDIVDDTGWSENRIQLIFAVYVFGYSSLSAVSGALTDRIGPRRVVAAGAGILTTGYLVWALAPNLWFVLLGLGIIAPIGMSASWVPCNATVVRWFSARRGLAVAISTAGGSLANIFVPPLAAAMVGAWGWRTALGTLAAIGGVAMLVAAQQMKRDPESHGQLPDGVQPTATGDQSSGDADISNGLTVQQAARTTAFRMLLVMYSLTFMVVFVPFVHISQFATDLGIGAVTAATVISAIGVGGLAGRLTAGPLSDTFERRHVAIAAFVLETIAFIMMATATGLAVLYPAAALFGFAYGAGVALLPALAGDYFGRAHTGAIVGRLFGIAGSMAAIGPYFAQLLVDASGSYRVAFGLSAGLNAAAMLMAWRLPSTTEAQPGGTSHTRSVDGAQSMG